MIEQQINLYHERFHEKRIWVSAAQVGLAVVLSLTVMAVASLLLHGERHALTRENQQAQAERNRLGSDLAVANAELTRLLEDTHLDNEISVISRQISARRDVLNFVDANRFGSGKGFSDYLVALSNLRHDEVWLEQIRLGENFVAIKGSSLTAEVVPVYFDRFSEEPAFHGNRFDLFQLSRADESDWKVDFEIATRETLSD